MTESTIPGAFGAASVAGDGSGKGADPDEDCETWAGKRSLSSETSFLAVVSPTPLSFLRRVTSPAAMDCQISRGASEIIRIALVAPRPPTRRNS